MKTLVSIMLALAMHASAADYPLRREIPSPDKQFSLVIFQENEQTSPTIEIKSADGDSLFTARADVLRFELETAIWSNNSQQMAIAADTGKAGFTYILVREGKKFVNVPGPNIPVGYDNGKIRPIRWISGNRLILEISGPHAGKADGYYFKGRSTVRVSSKNTECEVLYQYLSVHEGT